MELRIVNLTFTAGEAEAERFSDLPKATEGVTVRARIRAQEFLAPSSQAQTTRPWPQDISS